MSTLKDRMRIPMLSEAEMERILKEEQQKDRLRRLAQKPPRTRRSRRRKREP